jgi:hypothetical protein
MLLMSVSVPTAEFLLPLSLLDNLKYLAPILLLPVVLNTIAPAPFAVFLVPAVFRMERGDDAGSIRHPVVIAGGDIVEKAIPAKGTIPDPTSSVF